ncbi:hypothetical protein OROMI_025128 [Orobanche minor]
MHHPAATADGGGLAMPQVAVSKTGEVVAASVRPNHISWSDLKEISATIYELYEHQGVFWWIYKEAAAQKRAIS